MIVLNLKTYPESIKKALLFTDIAKEVVDETGLRIVVCPPMLSLHEAAERFSDVFSQHADPEKAGAHTGSIGAEMLKAAKVKGSLINHSERRVGDNARLKATVDSLHMHGLESLVCAASPEEAAVIAAYSPTYIAVEPPELIGSGVSVSTARPEVVSDSVKAVKDVDGKVSVLCGAGVSNRDDVKKSLELGASGVLLASAFVKSHDPRKFLTELASAF
ncbi:MAG: triose-phosphate isomerase [Candidatus Micrarchaeota archaeon]